MTSHRRPVQVPFPRINSFLFYLTKIAARVCLAPFFTLTVEGQGYLPQEGPFVLLPKHQRWEDIPLIGLASRWPLYYIAKHELFVHPVSRWFISSLGGIRLNRQRPLESREAITSIFSLLEQGERIVIFPEGTYYKNRTGPGHTGMIRMISARTKVAFIPVGLHYSPGKLRKLVRVRFGQPMCVDSHLGIKDFMARVMKEIAGLSDLAQS